MSLTTIVLLSLTLFGGPRQSAETMPEGTPPAAPYTAAQWFDCASDADCAEEEFCRFPRGECGGDGTCTLLPETCNMQYDPVCGCNEESYGNACEAFSYGVSVDYAGNC